MNESIKCTECGGNKCVHVVENTYRCLYCGTTISIKPSLPPTIPTTANAAASQPQVIVIQQPAANTQPYQSQNQSTAMRSHKDKTTTILLTFFLGGFGAQWFYLGKYGLGVISLLFCWTYIPGLIALIQFIMLLCMSTDEFNRKYNM